MRPPTVEGGLLLANAAPHCLQILAILGVIEQLRPQSLQPCTTHFPPSSLGSRRPVIVARAPDAVRGIVQSYRVTTSDITEGSQGIKLHENRSVF